MSGVGNQQVSGAERIWGRLWPAPAELRPAPGPGPARSRVTTLSGGHQGHQGRSGGGRRSQGGQHWPRGAALCHRWDRYRVSQKTSILVVLQSKNHLEGVFRNTLNCIQKVPLTNTLNMFTLFRMIKWKCHRNAFYKGSQRLAILSTISLSSSDPTPTWTIWIYFLILSTLENSF